MSLRAKVVAWFAAIVLAVVLSGFFAFERVVAYVRSDAQERIDARLDHVIDVLSTTNAIYARVSVVVLNLLGDSLKDAGGVQLENGQLRLGTGHEATESTILSEVSRLTGAPAALFVRDGDGLRLSGLAGGDPEVPAEVLAIRNASLGQLLEGRDVRVLRKFEESPYLISMRPLRNAAGEVVGAIGTAQYLESLRVLRDSLEERGILQAGFFALLDSDDHVVFQTRQKRAPEIAVRLGATGGGTEDGWYVSASQFKAWDYTVMAALHLPDVNALAWEFVGQIYSIAGSVLVCIFVISFWLATKLSRTLESERAARDAAVTAQRAVEQTQARLAAELDQASRYVRATLPAPAETPLRIDWCYIPSNELGGDSFGYHALDDDHFAFYLLDVCGHGVGASLLAVSVANVLETRSLSQTDFRDPAAVLCALNAMFPMERQNNMYFTAWYGVYVRSRRELVHASAGHPPALLFGKDGARSDLRSPGLVIGAMPTARYVTASASIPEGAVIFLLSDGAYEVRRPGEDILGLDVLAEFLAGMRESSSLEAEVTGWLGGHGITPPYPDDLSVVRLRFP